MNLDMCRGGYTFLRSETARVRKRRAGDCVQAKLIRI